MAEHRKHIASICVKTDAKTAIKIELFPAEQWEESAQGRFRCRINRRWHDLPEGGHAFLDMAQVGTLVADAASGAGEASPMAPAPDLPRGTSVRVPTRTLAGEQLYEVCRTDTDPIRGYDGRWWVSVFLFGKGVAFVPVDTLRIKQPKGVTQ